VTTEGSVILVCKVQDLVTAGEVKLSLIALNRRELATVFGSEEIVLLKDVAREKETGFKAEVVDISYLGSDARIGTVAKIALIDCSADIHRYMLILNDRAKRLGAS